MPNLLNPREVLLNAQIGQRIRDGRLSLDPRMSGTTLGNYLGISYQQLHKFETGTSHITAARLILAAEALQLPPAFLLLGWDD